MGELRVMGIAIAYGRIAYAMLSNDKLIDWHVSQAAGKSPEKARLMTREWVEALSPEVVVTERIGSNPRKRGRTLLLMEAVFDVIQKSEAISLATAKTRKHKNKYVEARILAIAYPELAPRLAKKPPIWLAEPRRMILFEALALALRLKETR